MKTLGHCSLLALGILAGCVINPPAKNPVAPVVSPLLPLVTAYSPTSGSVPSVLPPVVLVFNPVLLQLNWIYTTTLPTNNIEFDVEHSRDLAIWSLYCRTNHPPVPVLATNWTDFFRVIPHRL